jgi:hypothetical protein
MDDEIAKLKEQAEQEKERELLELSESQYAEYLSHRDTFIPSLRDIDEMLDSRIVGERYNRLSVFTVFVLSKICVYISGDSGAGKTQLMDAVTSTLLPGYVCQVSQGSGKLIFTNKKAREINKASYIVMPELNKVHANLDLVEVLKTWGEGKNASYERSEFGKKVDKVPLDCKPFIFSRATESSKIAPVPGELMTRVAEFMVDSSKEQTSDVMDSIAEAAEDPFSVVERDVVKEALIKYYVSNLRHDNSFMNPMAKVLTNYVPKVFAASRRDFKRYLRNINGICNFHYKNRMYIEHQRRVYLITPQDVFYNHIIFGQTLIRSAMRCNQIEKKIIKICSLTKSGFTKGQIQAALRSDSINTTLNNVETHLNELVNIGYLLAEKTGREYYYCVSDTYREFESKPNMRELVEYTIQSINHNPHLTDAQKSEYINRYCKGTALAVVHPFTGETVNILDYEFEDINDERTTFSGVSGRKVQVTL